MGTSPGQTAFLASSTMRATAILLLAVAAIKAEAEAEAKPYTIGQVAHGYGYGVVTGVDYGHGLVSGYGAIGNRGYLGFGAYGGHHFGKREAEAEAEPYAIGQVAHGLPIANAYATGHPHNVGYTRYIGYGGYGGHHFGKRDAEAEAEPYTIGQVAHGYGYGVVTGVDYGYGRVSGYGAIGNRG